MKGIPYYYLEIRKIIEDKYPILLNEYDKTVENKINHFTVFMWLNNKKSLFSSSSELNILISDFFWEIY